ncbi:MAG: hypothetical protein AB9903_28090 [Vulcanimicrobiota bacterium]
MNFPTASSLGFFLITGPIVLCFCLFFIIKYVKFLYASYILHVEPQHVPMHVGFPDGHMLLPFIIASLVIGSVHLLGSYSTMSNGKTFRNMKPESIRAIEVQKLRSEGKLEDTRIERIEDPQIILEAFNSVQNPVSYARNHEHYLDGYLLHFVKKEPDSRRDCYLSVYRKTEQSVDRIVDVDIVVPQVNSVNWGAVSNAGEFTCPVFMEWVKKRIDPLFWR